MKNLPWKKLAIGFGAVALSTLAVIYFVRSNKGNSAPSYIDPAFGEYIASYTAGVVPSASTVRIELVKDAVDSTQVGKESSVKLFSLSPSVSGTTVWLDKRTLEFKPEGRLTSGQVYSVSFYLSKLATVPATLSTFEYTFQVVPQNFEVSVENVKPYVKTELTRQKIEGLFTTADFAESGGVEQTIKAVQDGKDLKVTWTHAGEGKEHHFVVEDVTRKDQASAVKLSVAGHSIGIDRNEEKDVEIPSLGDFKLVNAKVIQSPNQYVVLQFSDPLKEKQELSGIIRLEDQTALDFDIHDNEVWAYPSTRQAGSKTVYVDEGIRNILDYRMKNATRIDVVFEQVKPAIRFTGKGTILPSTDGLVLPFEAVNLNAVDVKIKKIYENNVLQFLQVNNVDGSYEMRRVGKNILSKTVQLSAAGVTDLSRWNHYTLDLSTMINAEPGAIYQVRLSFKKSYSTYNCDGEPTEEDQGSQFDDDDDDYEGGDGEYYEDEYYYEDYDWEQRDNPCSNSYYTSSKAIKRNILASDLGMIAKQGDDNNTHVFITDLKTTKPISGVQVELYDFQQQLLGSVTTDGDGMSTISTKETPFALVAKNGTQRGYLKLNDGDALSLSNFDVSGEVLQKGLKGFLYGERGVWRPGDSLYLTFVLEDKNKILPATHPVVFELQNPQGQVVNRLVRSNSVNGFYSFGTVTAADAPTGNWTGRVKVGGMDFTQNIKIETVKPNRLKINLDFGTERFTSPSVSGNLDVKWLHGAPGKNLKVTFDVSLTSVPTTFKGYNDFTFTDPSKNFSFETQPIFDGSTDEEGHAMVNAELESSTSSPGFLMATFRGKAFEESGNFSTDRFSIPYSPYESYIGLRTPKGERYSGILYLDSMHRLDIVTVDADGKPVSRNGVEVNIYKLDWRWWWDNSYDNLANYVEGSYSKIAKTGKINTSNGKGHFDFKIEKPLHGRYYVRVCDPVSGHCSGQIIYLDEPGWYSRVRDDDSRGGATMLSFASDKATYAVGEKVKLTIPSSANGRALVSIENGSKVVQTFWTETTAGETHFNFDVTRAMTPNVYIHVTLLQPHSQTVNDLPIRLYGVTTVRVEDAKTHLAPIIDMPAVLEPGEKVTIKVSEKANQKMTYTVAVVDEGLLDITKFKTPDPWNRFYAREALGVRTWDLFDNVIGSFGGRIERLLAIGGDGEGSAKDDDARANRFKPVVKFLGPFTLDGGSNSHTFVMPQYIGSVRTMVVAGYEGAYGQAEKATPVRKPLMVLATLPRVLGPEELVKLPVTLFTQEKNVKNLKVDIKVSGLLHVNGSASQTVAMPKSGDLTVNFDLGVASATGKATVEVTATSGNLKATDKIEIDVRNPNLPVSKINEMVVEAGKVWNNDVVPFGIAGSNSALLEVSSMPPLNLGSRLDYLIQYPYGCIEQTTSSVFPQLYLSQVRALTETESNTVQRNVTLGIERLKSFMTRDNGFSYWPGYENADSWGTSYAGHFLIEAEAKGYYVPADMLKRWKKYQKNKALEWRRDNAYYNSDLMQAYRLYTLALSGAPEISAMNRLRETSTLATSATWMLAAAYAKAGQPETGKKLITGLTTHLNEYRELGYTYGSPLRDKALILETLTLLGDRTKGFEIMKEIAKSLSGYGYWMSTQEVAFCLKAVTTFASLDKRGELRFSYTINGKTTSVKTDKPISLVTLPITGTQKLSVKMQSESTGMLYARVISQGTPARGEEEDAESNISMDVQYTDMHGGVIDITRLEQGTEFMAVVTVRHPGVREYYQNLALSQVFPSGWEINNLRLNDDENLITTSAFTYQDIRDDRVYTFFDLGRQERVTYRVSLTAAYVGKYYMPATSCEAMYDKSIYTRKKGYVVEVFKPEVQ